VSKQKEGAGEKMMKERKGQVAIDREGNLYLVEQHPDGTATFFTILNKMPVTPPNSLKAVSTEFPLWEYGRAYND